MVIPLMIQSNCNMVKMDFKILRGTSKVIYEADTAMLVEPPFYQLDNTKAEWGTSKRTSIATGTYGWTATFTVRGKKELEEKEKEHQKLMNSLQTADDKAQQIQKEQQEESSALSDALQKQKQQNDKDSEVMLALRKELEEKDKKHQKLVSSLQAACSPSLTRHFGSRIHVVNCFSS